MPVIDQPTANRIPIRAKFVNPEDNPSFCHFFVNTNSEKYKWMKNINAVIILLQNLIVILFV